MLEALRNATGGIIAKLFIGLLVMSFAVWGIADIFTGGSGNSLAKVGNTEISQLEFQRVFRLEMRALSQRLGRNIDLNQARAVGLDREVLSRLVGQATLDTHISDLGLKLSNQAIADSIANNPAFKDGTGKFNRSQFQAVLFQNGISEDAYVESERNSLLRGQIGRIVETGIKPPDILLNTLYNYQSEKRQVTYFTVPAAAAGTTGEPTEAEVSSYYDLNKAEFKAPEYRKIAVLSLQPKDVADTIEITEQDLTQAYKQREKQFDRLEKREVLQITFSTKQEAEKARTGLTTFEDFKALAKERGLADGDLTLGTLEKSEIIDTKIAEAAFSLPENKISDPVEGSVSTAILYVKSLISGGKIPFDDVREKLKSTLALERAQDEILTFHDSIEDERAGGAMLSEIAKKLSLKAILIEAIDKSGNDRSGIKIAELPASPELLQQTFSGEVGVEIAPIETAAGGYIWLEIEKIIPSTERPLSEAKTAVVESWKAKKRQEKLSAFSKTLIERVKSGESFLKVASSIGQKVDQSKELDRFASDDNISRAGIAKIFVTDRDEIISAPATQPDKQVILKVAEINTPAYESTSADAKALDQYMKTSLSQSLMIHYETALRQNVGVEVNQRAWAQVTGEAGADSPGHTHGPGTSPLHPH